MLTALFSLTLIAQETPPRPAPPEAREIAPEVWLIPGGVTEDREPDGNTVVFGSGAELVVFDTGRHAWHREAIEARVAADGRPVAAIVNSHWHLDHVTGNLALAERWPDAPVFASRAIEGVIEGFMRPSVARGQAFLDSGQAPPALAEDVRGDIAVIERAEELIPDRALEAIGSLPAGDGRLQVRIAEYAATEADVWLFDPASGVAAVGDLITLPAPFLDTACPDGWLAALDEVLAEPFRLVVPGHGPVMGRAEVERYRTALGAFIDCARGTTEAETCAGDWAAAVSDLQETEFNRGQAAGFAAYYVGMLRESGGSSAYCRAGV